MRRTINELEQRQARYMDELASQEAVFTRRSDLDNEKYQSELKAHIATVKAEIFELQIKTTNAVAQQRRRLKNSIERLCRSRPELHIIHVPLHDPDSADSALLEKPTKAQNDAAVHQYTRAELEALEWPAAARKFLDELRRSNAILLQRCEEVERLIEANFHEESDQSGGFLVRRFDPNWVCKATDLSTRHGLGATMAFATLEYLSGNSAKASIQKIVRTDCDYFAMDEKSWHAVQDDVALGVPNAAYNTATQEHAAPWKAAIKEMQTIELRIKNLFQGTDLATDLQGVSYPKEWEISKKSKVVGHQQEVDREIADIIQQRQSLNHDLRARAKQLHDKLLQPASKCAQVRVESDMKQNAQQQQERGDHATANYCWTLLQDAALPTWGLPGNGRYYSARQQPGEEDQLGQLQPDATQQFHELTDALVQEHERLIPPICAVFGPRTLLEECQRRVCTSVGSDSPVLGMLVLVDPSTGAMITHDGIERLQEDPDGEYFPWDYSAKQKTEWAAQLAAHERAVEAAAEREAARIKALELNEKALQEAKSDMVRT